LNTKVGAHLPYAEPEYRSELEQSSLEAIWTLLEARGIVRVHQQELIGICLWKFTEAGNVPRTNKYGTRFRSRGALDVENPSDVNHEHVGTRKWLRAEIMTRYCEKAGREAIERFIRDHAVACVVTKEEHSRLSSLAQELQGWQRYAAANVEVIDMLTGMPFDTAAAVPARI